MAHWEYKPPVRQFFLSVACYVVKPEVQKFKRKKKCREQKETRCFQQKTAGFVELLPRFELGTSSLPTDCPPSKRLHMALWGRFCSGKSEAMVLSAPLPPPARFLLWVRLWVKTQKQVHIGMGNPQPGHPNFAPL